MIKLNFIFYQISFFFFFFFEKTFCKSSSPKSLVAPHKIDKMFIVFFCFYKKKNWVDFFCLQRQNTEKSYLRWRHPTNKVATNTLTSKVETGWINKERRLDARTFWTMDHINVTFSEDLNKNKTKAWISFSGL